MSKHKYTSAVCAVIVAVTLALTAAFMAAPYFGVTAAHTQPAYALGLFNTERVHTLDIVMNETDWDAMIISATMEEYRQCSVVLDGELVKGVGIRPKGNSSLSTIASSDSDRYSFKIEFDHYVSGKNYYGLDKLALNNIAQDNTYMKDYVSYQMMNAMGANAPLSSFIWITVNGRDWGLYLAVEGIEDAYARRVFGNNYGKIYKPDTMDLNADDDGNRSGAMPEGFPNQNGGERPNRMPAGDGGELPSFENMPREQMPNFEGFRGENAEEWAGAGMPQGGFGGRGNNSAVSLIYTDDNPESYAAIFDNSAFNTSTADQNRLIAAIKRLNEGQNLEETVDTDAVLRYFVVHNFVLNSDSYTGSMTHNYYLYEKDGQLSMIAWDYNLAFGGMGGWGGTTDTALDTATTMVNYPIDSPMLSGTTADKPMIAWIFESEEYTAQYHEIFAEFMSYFETGEFASMYDSAIALISPYAEKDPSAFCTYEAFQKGQSALREFCMLRAESIRGQLNGTIAATSEAQTATANAGFIDASAVDMSSMGSSSMGFNRVREDGQMPGRTPAPEGGRADFSRRAE